LHSKFPKISEAKIKKGIFDGPQIWELLRNQVFEGKMTDLEKKSLAEF